jgi:hypothetical protein
MPYEVHAKDVDDHKAPENIAKQCSVDREYQSEESRDPQHQEDKELENHQMAEQGIAITLFQRRQRGTSNK